ncbi:hypothetical protein SUGI_1307510 [Cryptomeria japonica]|uniref:Uncharacterized protein n=1 Tax=Cryptomeria japonica TaxID=3369 RepID=A0AAD3NKQ9_CRYJA|nr:hypothetical protein SUGI_1307510 [Cryptomeria japonica]
MKVEEAIVTIPNCTKYGILVWKQCLPEKDDEFHSSQHDISIDSLSTSAQGKDLLKNASMKISHGKHSELLDELVCEYESLEALA